MSTLRAACAVAALVLVAACVTAPTQDALNHADYGAAPTAYADRVRAYFRDVLKDPSSAQYLISEPIKGYMQKPPLAGGGTLYGWLVNVSVNGKNSYGAYSGFQSYQFLFRGEQIVDVIFPTD